MEKELMNEALADLLSATNYPAHKRGRTSVMFRRLVERAEPTTWEYHALMGVLARASKTIRRERAGLAARSARHAPRKSDADFHSPRRESRGSTRRNPPRRR